MELDASHLESRYLECCRRQDVLPNPSVLESFAKVKDQRSCYELCVFEIFIDQLAHHDFFPLMEAFSASNLSGIDVVDVRQESPGSPFKGRYVLSLLRTINQKLRIVDLYDWLFWKDILRDICQRGLACQILYLTCSPISKLNVTGYFPQLHTLILDFSIYLASFTPACFNCMPNLMRLSMCETQIANLWMTSSALSKLPSLIELRFQNCLCCHNTGPCPKISGLENVPFAYETIPQGQQGMLFYPGQLCSTLKSSVFSERISFPSTQYHVADVARNYFLSDDSFTSNSLHSPSEDSLDSEVDFSGYQDLGSLLGRSSQLALDVDLDINLESLSSQTAHSAPISSTTKEIPVQQPEDANSSENISEFHDVDMFEDLNSDFPLFSSYIELHDHSHPDEHTSASLILNRNEEHSRTGIGILARAIDHSLKKHVSHHPSPICFEEFYRQYMVASLPHLKVLDNIPINDEERNKAKAIVNEHFEQSPYNRSSKESVVSILKNREIGMGGTLRSSSHLKQPLYSSSYSSSRSLSAAKVNSCPWPCLNPFSKFRVISREESRTFCPRQFEYHPSDTALLVFGTLDGEIVVINHETGNVVGYVPSTGALQSILGLCWLKQYPSKLIAGSDDGSLKLYDISQLSSVFTDRYWGLDAVPVAFDNFEHLTSVHVNSTDQLFLASGFTKHVALYDIGSGRCLEVFRDLHAEHINVVKFSHHSPSIFATASFDQEIKMWDFRQGLFRPCFTTSSSRGNVMVCFSPDDQYLLSSAVDNEVKQHLAVDGRIHTSFNIVSTGSAHNYTRSYYMNGRDYIISGSSEENVVRVCCAQTGRRLRDIYLQGKGSRNSLFVQSLRGDPFRAFHMSVLATYLRPTSKSEIIRVNLLGSGVSEEEDSCVELWHPSNRMGG